MRLNSTCLVAVAACAAFLGGCHRGVMPNDQSAQQSPEGRPCPPQIGMIEDGEDNNNQIIVSQGRGGYMYTFVDKVGSTITPKSGESGGIFETTPGGANGTKFALRISGSISNAEIVYAGMGMNFTEPKGQYDASKYGGIAFWGKRGPGSTRKVRLKIPDVDTDPDGGVCSECFNDFGVDLFFNDQWEYFVVPFDKMRQLKGWGAPHKSSIDPSKIYAIQFQVNDKGKNYDIWVDELTFTGCGG